MSQAELYELRRSQINAFRESGLTADIWCQENHVKVSTLRYWLRRIRVKENSAADETAWVQLARNGRSQQNNLHQSLSGLDF